MGDTDIADKGKIKKEDRPRAILNKFSFSERNYLARVHSGVCGDVFTYTVCVCEGVGVHGHLSVR